jgi:tRNA-2-methylthio-N6-dimethylallyladenosine synthase
MNNPKLYIETYGCQMNVADSEVVAAILQQHHYNITENADEADLILINTCSIRDNAEQRVRGRLENLAALKKKKNELVIGVIGCMAERVKEKLLDEEKMVDLVVGPDAYRDLPQLITSARKGEKAVNTMLSIEETYGDISPVRLDQNKVSAFISIMRGCNNLCSYCVVPYTRGRERSREPETILREAGEIFEMGYREVTLLGQNVNSYHWSESINDIDIHFHDLLEKVAQKFPEMRIRFSTSHPKDMSDEVLKTIARYDNICKNIHLPVQSGSTSVLSRMKRRYTREEYLGRIKAIKEIIPQASISTDIIVGFCGETEEDHQETLSLMEEVGYDFAFMFKYSERPGTLAAKKYDDDVPEESKTRRLNEIIKLQNKLSLKSKTNDVGKTFEVLIEGVSKKSGSELFGRTSQNKVVVFPKNGQEAGNYIKVNVESCTSATLMGKTVQ